ncbi:hypothetical protein COUCH_26105 [Couchioplanes caeruleus]|uniref:hypothetical protein n=1 Tax=Couchioplanes caeruleus TaxID=56438 RepID=UPI0020BF25BD|nr:hypothetical protein [Couchioplanes caeruleus]UQU62495.1 hypothetical protein COUCH_26105 [Couchioplanes caeruleus]
MVRRGITYDVGTRTGPYLSRPTFDASQTRHDLTVIRDELHCTAVRVSGTSRKRLLDTTGMALDLGLEVWLSPLLHDGDPAQTLANIRQCAAAAQALGSSDLVFLLGCELTLFMRGIMKGETVAERLRPHRRMQLKYLGTHNRPLNAFLARAGHEVRQVFTGPVSYASAPIESVDWSLFDFVCLDYYRVNRNRHDYGARLQRHFAHGKPVIITEVGCCTYRGAEDKGGMGWDIISPDGHDRLTGSFVRDETLQAGEVIDMLEVVEKSGVEGAFVHTFAAPSLPHRAEPDRDLDMASYGVVKCYDDGHWEPKQLFQALAEHNAATGSA